MKKFILAVVASVMLVSSAAVPVLAAENNVQASSGISTGENQTEKELLECLRYYYNLEIEFYSVAFSNSMALDIWYNYALFNYSGGDTLFETYSDLVAKGRERAVSLKQEIDLSIQNASAAQKEQLTAAQSLSVRLVQYYDILEAQITRLNALKLTSSTTNSDNCLELYDEISRDISTNTISCISLTEQYYIKLYKILE